jgi:hypothetical protein
MRDRLITVVGSGYFQPILDLAERLVQKPRGKVNASRINGRENGYALSIVLLSVVMLESFVGRVSDLQARLGANGKTKAFRTSVPSYIAQLRRSFTLEKSLTEVFVLRDAIAHGHVWQLEVSSHERHGQLLRSAALGTQYGNEQFKRRVNPNTRRTRALGLHVVPSAVGREEVIKVLDVIHRVLKFLARSHLIEPNVFKFRGRFDCKPFDFWSVLQVLRCAA